MALIIMEKVSVLDKLLWEKTHPDTTVASFILSYQRAPPYQGQGERCQGHKGESILFLHTLLRQPFNLLH